jgi:5-oxoprolinase (ATP-hydrolysing) subunit C
MLEVLEPGLLTTVQDGGRPGFTDLGVPIGGACDPWSLAVANLLLGNASTDAALEISLAGPELRVLRRCVVALAGADLGALVTEEGRSIRPGTAHLVHPGTRIAFSHGAIAGGPGDGGARAYLAVPGGLDVPVVLGSRGTSLVGGFGGVDGRPLRRGDRIGSRRPDDIAAAGRIWPDAVALAPPRGPVRLLPAPPSLARPVPDAFAALIGTEWHVGSASDRQGIRLEGPSLAVDARSSGLLPSRGVIPGVVQVPPGGRPIVLLADAQTVGGYPVAGVVPATDLPVLAQLRPGATFRFVSATLADVTAARRARAIQLATAARLLAATEDWHAIADAMG